TAAVGSSASLKTIAGADNRSSLSASFHTLLHNCGEREKRWRERRRLLSVERKPHMMIGKLIEPCFARSQAFYMPIGANVVRPFIVLVIANPAFDPPICPHPTARASPYLPRYPTQRFKPMPSLFRFLAFIGRFTHCSLNSMTSRRMLCAICPTPPSRFCFGFCTTPNQHLRGQLETGSWAWVTREQNRLTRLSAKFQLGD